MGKFTPGFTGNRSSERTRSAHSQAKAIQLLRWRTALGLDDPVPIPLEEAAEDSRHPVHDEDVAEPYQVSDAVLMTNASEGLRLPCWQLRQPGPDYDLPVFHEIGEPTFTHFQLTAGATPWLRCSRDLELGGDPPSPEHPAPLRLIPVAHDDRGVRPTVAGNTIKETMVGLGSSNAN